MAWSLEFALFGLDKEAGLITWVPLHLVMPLCGSCQSRILLYSGSGSCKEISDPDPDPVRLKVLDPGESRSATLL
jgi:hypothetical protein